MLIVLVHLNSSSFGVDEEGLLMQQAPGVWTMEWPTQAQARVKRTEARMGFRANLTGRFQGRQHVGAGTRRTEATVDLWRMAGGWQPRRDPILR